MARRSNESTGKLRLGSMPEQCKLNFVLALSNAMDRQLRSPLRPIASAHRDSEVIVAADRQILTAPDAAETGMPPGIPYIVTNELAERFSFYGMKCILTIFMTRYLVVSVTSDGVVNHLADNDAKGVYHLFTAGAYFFPMLGAIIADVYWGKYKTILWISLMYCVGHGLLAMMDFGPETSMVPFFYGGLILIAIGAGGIKPCVSAHVGDQFGLGNKHLLTKVFNWFYFSINLGAAISTLLTPILLEQLGPWAAFGLPGVLMAIATFLFWIGRHTFVHVPPSGWAKFRAETFSSDGVRALKNLAPLFLVFVPVFWAIFDQTGSAWVLQSESMNRNFLGFTWLEAQVQLVNPVLILTLIPVFTYYVYPAMGKLFDPTPLRKIGIGFIMTAAAFTVSALIEMTIEQKNEDTVSAIVADVSDTLPSVQDSLSAEALASVQALVADPPEKVSSVVKELRLAQWDAEKLGSYVADMPSIGWQFFAYLLLTSGEVLVSIVCLEFAYTQSPPRMKSFIMGVYFLGVSFGNLAVSALNFLLEAFKRDDGTTPLDGSTYYWFFVGMMLFTLVIYIFFAMRYKGETFIQGETSS